MVYVDLVARVVVDELKAKRRLDILIGAWSVIVAVLMILS